MLLQNHLVQAQQGISVDDCLRFAGQQILLSELLVRASSRKAVSQALHTKDDAI